MRNATNLSTFFRLCLFFSDLLQPTLKCDRPNESLTDFSSFGFLKENRGSFLPGKPSTLRSDPATMKRNTGAAAGVTASASASSSGETARPKTLSGLSSQGSTEVSSAAAERLADWRQSLSDQVLRRDFPFLSQIEQERRKARAQRPIQKSLTKLVCLV